MKNPKEYKVILNDDRGLSLPLGMTQPTHTVIDKRHYDFTVSLLKQIASTGTRTKNELGKYKIDTDPIQLAKDGLDHMGIEY